VPSITEIWQRIHAHQNEPFKTTTGLPFTYSVSGNELFVDRTSDFPLHACQFEKALALVPIARPNEINRLVRGPSYVWAILHDARVRRNDW